MLLYAGNNGEIHGFPGETEFMLSPLGIAQLDEVPQLDEVFYMNFGGLINL